MGRFSRIKRIVRKALIWLARLAVGAAIASAAFPQAPVGQPVRAGIAREAMYLRLFQEIDQFEAQADQLEAQGIAAPTLRGYHQKWLSLSPNHATLLKQVAKSCVQDLRSQGVISGGGVSATRRPVAERGRQVMARTASAVDSLAAAMGPAQFAYFDSMVRRHVATPSAGPGLASIPEPVSVRGAASAPASARRGRVLSGSCWGNDCPYPDYEDSAAVSPSWVTGGGSSGGSFTPQLQATSVPYVEFSGRTVSEALGALESDGCFNSYQAAGIDHLPVPQSYSWAIDPEAFYDAPDVIADPNTWIYGYIDYIRVHDPFGDGCGEGDVQYLTIDGCVGTWPSYSYAENFPGISLSANTIYVFRGNGVVIVNVPVDPY